MKFLFFVCLVGLYFLTTVFGGEGDGFVGGPGPLPPASQWSTTSTTPSPTLAPTRLRRHRPTHIPATTSGGTTTTSYGGGTTTPSGATTTSGGETTTTSGATTTSGGTTTTSGATTTPGGPGIGTTTPAPGGSTSTTLPGNANGGPGVTNPGANLTCFNYTLSHAGLLNLTRIILSIPCLDLCALLGLVDILNADIPIYVDITALGQPVTAVGYVGASVAGEYCGVVIDVDIHPVFVNVLNTIEVLVCLDATVVISLELINTLIGSITGTLALYLGPVLYTFSTLVPNLCSFGG